MTLVRPGGGEERIPFTGCLQPRSAEGGRWSDPLGIGQERLYTLYVPRDGAGAAMEPGDTVEFRGRRYHVLRKETYWLQGAPMYDRAVVRGESGP